MGWMTGVQFPAWTENSSLFATMSRPTLGPTQPPIQWVPSSLSLEIKQPGSEADHSSLFTMLGAIPPLPHMFAQSSA